MSISSESREAAARMEAQENYNRQLAWSRLDGKPERECIADAMEAFAAIMDDWFPSSGGALCEYENEA